MRGQAEKAGLGWTAVGWYLFEERLRESCIMLRSLTQHTSNRNKQERKKNSKILSAVYKKFNLEEALESYTHGQVVAKDKATFCTKSSPLLIFDICFTFESRSRQSPKSCIGWKFCSFPDLKTKIPKMTPSAISSPPLSFLSFKTTIFYVFSADFAVLPANYITNFFKIFWKKTWKNITKKNSKIITDGGIRTSLPTIHCPLP